MSYMTVSCKNSNQTPGSLPVCKGRIGNRLVSVLRDTGCSGVVVKRSLVAIDDFLGETKTCMLADGSKISVPTASVRVDTPYFEGIVTAWCMEAPVYDIILGNIKGARAPDDPNPCWRADEEVSAVQTRAQKKMEDKPLKPLRVPQALQEIEQHEFKTAQDSDETLVVVRKLVESGDVKERRDGGTSRFFRQKGLIYREFTSPAIANGRVFKQLIVPLKYREQILRLAHDSIMAGHLGAKKTGDRIMVEFYWPSMNADVTRFCRSCDICQRTFPKGKVTKAPIGTMPLIDVPFQRVAIDIVGPLHPPSERGHRYLLTIVDYATRYPEAVALKRIHTEEVAEALVDVYSRVGVPREVLTDMGSQFTSEVMREVNRLLSIRHLTTTPYNPKCNGLVEKFNGTLKKMLRRMCVERPRDWDKYVNALLFSYREVPQESLGFSPFELLYGRTVRGPMMILRELLTKDTLDPDTKTTYQYVIDLKEKLEDTCKLAQEHLKSATDRQAKLYNRKAKPKTMHPGDRVLVLLPTDKNKLLMQWRGPFVIEERKGPLDYRVNVNGKVKTLHANLLRQYITREASSAVVPEEDRGMLAIACASIVEEFDESDEIGLPDLTEGVVTTPTSVQTETLDQVLVSDQLTEEQRHDVRSLLEEFSDVLTDVPGKTDLVEHDIKMTTDEPVRSGNRTLPFHTKEVINKEVEKMMKMGVIEPSDSPFAAPVVIVRKRDNTNRFCIDYRQLNRVTVFDAEPMPNSEDIFARLAGHKYISRLDLSKGYWQVPMSEGSKKKTAFSTPGGLYQFSVMPFGLVNAPATFCRLMRKLLRGMSGIESFIDDILIYSMTWQEHLRILRELFSRLRSAMITARPTKCAIGYRSLDCLGHVVGNERLQPQADKVEAIMGATRPETKKQVRSFLGLVGFYRKFIPNFSSIAVPLTDLTRKGQPNRIVWEDVHETAFNSLKKMLSGSPILKLPDLQSEFILRTDASDYGLGAVLLQKEGDISFPVAYASRKLKGGEKSYAVVEKEALAVVWGVQKFQRYLYGTEFVLETDHQPLLYMNRMKGTNARVMRWALVLQPCRFRIRAIKGSENVGADYLSRIG